MNTTHRITTIGQDNGIGNSFTADVLYADGVSGRITVYGENLQGTSRLLQMFAPFYNFTVTGLC